MAETNNHTEVEVTMSQSGGQGAQAAFTGPDATKILDRLAAFPAAAHEHPVGYEAELATYTTIPIPVPTFEEREDQALVLADCLQQKLGLLKVLSDLDLALSQEGSVLFDGLPSSDDLVRLKGQYQAALNGLIRHAILVATGKMNPPQVFIANPAPPAISLKKKVLPSAPQKPQIALRNVVRKMPVIAHSLLATDGLKFVDVDAPEVAADPLPLHPPHHPGALPLEHHPGDTELLVVRQVPAAGTMVDIGSTVTLGVKHVPFL